MEKVEIFKGLTAILGSGGKTTLGHKWAEELEGTVIFTTSTRIFPSEKLPVFTGNREEDLVKQVKKFGKICIGSPGEQGKLGAPAFDFQWLCQVADYVLVEADGSKGLPIKAHRDFEPVIPAGCNQRILVVGANGFGREIGQICHCPEIFARLAGCEISDFVTARRLGKVIAAEGLADMVMVNQATEKHRGFIAELQGYLQAPLAVEPFDPGK